MHDQHDSTRASHDARPTVKPPRHVVVCGAGVVGASSAYFLARRGVAVTVVERPGWRAPRRASRGASSPSTGATARHSGPSPGRASRFTPSWRGARDRLRLSPHGHLHAGGARARRRSRWPSRGGACLARRRRRRDRGARLHRDHGPGPPGALHRGAARGRARPGTACARHRRGRRRGATARPAVSRSTARRSTPTPSSWPWGRGRAAAGARAPEVRGLKGYSVTLDAADVPAHALFVDYRTADGRAPGARDLSPPRRRGLRVRDGRPGAAAGLAGARRGERRACEALARAAGRVSPRWPRRASPPAGLLPARHRRRPAADRPRPGVAGAYVATGHGPWGMLNAPATGLALAELIADGAASLWTSVRSTPPGCLPGARCPPPSRRHRPPGGRPR